MRSRSHGAAATYARPHRSRIERSRGKLGTIGKVVKACWRDCSDDSRATAAKRYFGEENLADRVLYARNGAGLASFGVGGAAVDRHSWPVGDRTRSKLGGSDDDNRQR